MRKGKVEKICGAKIYVSYERKSVDERGRIRRPAVFRSKKDYSRNRVKKETYLMKSCI